MKWCRRNTAKSRTQRLLGGKYCKSTKCDSTCLPSTREGGTERGQEVCNRASTEVDKPQQVVYEAQQRQSCLHEATGITAIFRKTRKWSWTFYPGTSQTRWHDRYVGFSSTLSCQVGHVTAKYTPATVPPWHFPPRGKAEANLTERWGMRGECIPAALAGSGSHMHKSSFSLSCEPQGWEATPWIEKGTQRARFYHFNALQQRISPDRVQRWQRESRIVSIYETKGELKLEAAPCFVLISDHHTHKT